MAATSSLSQAGKFNYHAMGRVFSGEIHDPYQEDIEPVALSTLQNTTGGFDHRRENAYSHRNIFSFETGHSHASGRYNPDAGGAGVGGSDGAVCTVIEGLDILGVITAERIVGRVHGIHVYHAPQAQYGFFGTCIRNLRIAGCDVEVELEADRVNNLYAHDAFQKKSKLKDNRGQMSYNLVKTLNCSKCSGVTFANNKIVIPTVGTLYLAEVKSWHNQLSLTMMRLELGSPVKGNAAIGEHTARFCDDDC